MFIQKYLTTFSFFISLSVLAQVSSIEGLEPLDGVVIPKAETFQSTTKPLEENILFEWPAVGAWQSIFDETKSRGIDISGKLGDPILAAADGLVVYAGSGLRGYGNLIILKHNNNYLTAYAHNQALFVREEQSVKKGQKIAEMGNSDSDQIKLHFEIRKQGKPIDPILLLPKQYVDVPRSEQEDQKVEDLRQQAIKRLKSLGASAAGPVDPVNESKGSGRPSESYLGRLRARVKPNITFSDSQLQSVRGNPAAEVEVIVSPSGQIVDMKLTQPSGNADWDQAVLKALEKTGTLPRDENGKIPPKIPFRFRPRD